MISQVISATSRIAALESEGMLRTPPSAGRGRSGKMAALQWPMFSRLFCLFVYLGHARGVLYEGGKLGGYSGDATFDHIDDLGLDYEMDRVRLHSVQVWATGSAGLLGFAATYTANDTVSNIFDPGTRMASLFLLIYGAGTTPTPDISVTLQPGDILESMGGRYSQSNDIYVINAVSFTVLRSSGAREEYSAGRANGWSTSIIGPVVGFYGATGLQFDQLGVYIDPEEWRDRPSRMLQGPRYGLSKSRSANLFDDFAALGSPFAVSMRNTTVHASGNIIKGLVLVYLLDSGEERALTHGSLDGTSIQRTIVFEAGDYVQSIQVGLPQSDTSQCLSYVRFTIFRAGQLVPELVAAGNLESASFVLSGPVGAFYGFSDSTCISGLGTYVLLPGSEVKDTCLLPPLPENTNYSLVPEPISAGSVITLVCQNGYLLVTEGNNMTCQESGAWSGEVQCQRGCSLLQVPVNGSALESPDIPLVGTHYTFACGLGCELVGSQTRMCTENETWTGNITQCNCAIPCGEAPEISNGRVDSTSSNVSVTQYSCESGYTLSGSERITCNGSSGRWSIRPFCVQEAGVCSICDSVVNIGVPAIVVAVPFILSLCCLFLVQAVVCYHRRLTSRKMVSDTFYENKEATDNNS